MAERASLSSLGSVCMWTSGLLNSLAGYVVFLRSTEAHPLGLSDAAGYSRMALWSASVMGGAMLVSALGTQRAALEVQPDEDRLPAVGLRELPRAIWGMVQSGSYRAALLAGVAGSAAFGRLESTNNHVSVYFRGLKSEDIGA